ncbi:MAG: MFS transporter [Pirellulales bacterium]|nr:MFS transporter [Pirellulales bacterium]
MSAERPWYKDFNRYHWFVLIVCTGGWMFDCFDQQLFNLARKTAITSLLGVEEGNPLVDQYSTIATSALLIGWATGGIIFGILGDRIGRAKTIVFTLLMYSVFSGLSGYSPNLWIFLLLRFMAGLGVGGQFAIGVTLVSESVPAHTRTQALGMLQALSAVGNIAAGLVYLFAVQYVFRNSANEVWRYIFTVTVFPAVILVILVLRYLHEPEAWVKAHAERKSPGKKGGMTEMFTDPRWAKRATIGLLLAASGVLGLWAIGVFSNDLNQTVFRKNALKEDLAEGKDKIDLAFAVQLVNSGDKLNQLGDQVLQIKPKQLIVAKKEQPDAQALAAAAIALYRNKESVTPHSVLAYLDEKTETREPQTAEDLKRREALLAAGAPDAPPLETQLTALLERQKQHDRFALSWTCVSLILFNIGAFFGIYAFAKVTHYIGRRPTFAIFFTIDAACTIIYFLFMKERSQLYWMSPMLGFAQLSVFGGYAIYFPELFPTRMRSTGTSFCYNFARYIGAAGCWSLGMLATAFYGTTLGCDEVARFRYAGVTMCACFLVGLVTLLFAPETKDQPLPE